MCQLCIIKSLFTESYDCEEFPIEVTQGVILIIYALIIN